LDLRHTAIRFGIQQEKMRTMNCVDSGGHVMLLMNGDVTQVNAFLNAGLEMENGTAQMDLMKCNTSTIALQYFDNANYN
jgi:hypothetical protein